MGFSSVRILGMNCKITGITPSAPNYSIRSHWHELLASHLPSSSFVNLCSKHHWKGSTLMSMTGKPWLENETSGGVSLWMLLLHLSQIESRRPRIKDNFASPESNITQPEVSQQTLFVLNVTDCSLVTCTPINLRYFFTVIMVIIILMDEQKRKEIVSSDYCK